MPEKLKQHNTPAWGHALVEALARAVWKPLFGEDFIKRNPHQKAVLVDDIWVVRCVGGGLHPGGDYHAYIKRDTGEILRVYVGM